MQSTPPPTSLACNDCTVRWWFTSSASARELAHHSQPTHGISHAAFLAGVFLIIATNMVSSRAPTRFKMLQEYETIAARSLLTAAHNQRIDHGHQKPVGTLSVVPVILTLGYPL